MKNDYLPALIGLGNVHKALKNYTAAIKVYNRAIEIHPQSHESWYGKALIAESLQRYQEAKEAYQKAIAIKPNWQSAIDGLTRVEQK